MWRYCRDSCPAASCITVTVVSELRSSIKSLQLFQRLWLCRSYPCPNISILSWNTIGLFLVFFSAVFLKVLELVEREAPKDFCCFVFHAFLGLCNHSHSSRRIQLCVQVCWVAASNCKAFTVAYSNCQCSPKCAVALALLPSGKVTITPSLTENLRYVFHLEILHAVVIPPTPNLEKCGHDGRPARAPSLVFFHSITSLVVPETATSQLRENYVDAAWPSAVFRTCI